jgi:hypothetical protein
MGKLARCCVHLNATSCIDSIPQLFRTVYSEYDYCVDLETGASYKPNTDELPIAGHPYVFYKSVSK